MQVRSVAPESSSRIAAMFDRIAPRYDLLNQLLSARQDRRWRQAMVALLPWRQGGTLLDVATGTGDVLFAAAAKHPEYRVFAGVDISEGMLAVARDKATRLGVAGEFATMDATELKFGERTVDAITIAFGLRNVVDKGRALDEFNRVLKPGGKLLILEFFLPQKGLLARLFQFYFHQILPKIGGLLSDRDAYTYLPQSVGSFYSRGQLRDELYRRGLIVEEDRGFLFGACRLIGARRS